MVPNDDFYNEAGELNFESGNFQEPANESNGFTLMKGLSTHGVSRLMDKANLPPEVYHAE